MVKKPAFPNDTFKSQQEYFDFTDTYHVYGNAAYNLKKELDKRKKILYPKIIK